MAAITVSATLGWHRFWQSWIHHNPVSMGDEEKTYMKNNLLPGGSGSILGDLTCEFSFILARENAALCLANVCCMVEKKKEKNYYFHSWYFFLFFPEKGL